MKSKKLSENRRLSRAKPVSKPGFRIGSKWKWILGGVLFLAAIIVFASIKPGAFLALARFLKQVR